MTIEQIYTGCLAQGAYYIKSEGEAAIIDPLREVSPYISRAKADGVNIKYVFETHFHADFVSGHVTLAEATGATIVYGPSAKTDFDAHIASDGEIFKVGAITIKVLHTPGHTMESSTYLLQDASGNPHAIFTGDTLFLGDVGRPDLAQKADSVTQEDLAGLLFDSLRTKIMPLPDDITVYPGHGAGSACGKNMMKETVDTLGNQKKMNYALRADMTKAEFIKEVTTGLLPPPGYFPANVMMNKKGYAPIDKVLSKGVTPLNPNSFEESANFNEALILDVRSAEDYAKGHIPGSIFIGLKGGFAPWVGALIVDVQLPLLLVVNEGEAKEAVTRLSRVGFDHTLGYLEGGMASWINSGKEIDTVNTITVNDFEATYLDQPSKIIDVRKVTEYQSEHLKVAENAPLSNINAHLKLFSETQDKVFIHCQGGYRSMIAASILKSRGIHNFTEVRGGYAALAKTQIPKTDYVCPSTL